ncbi:MAG: response regulator transcription factor [Geminicoccaceae bacterium]
MNVLLVEDEVRVADFIRRGLKGEGWSVEHVADGESALDLLDDQTFDAMVLDLMLPGISGQDVCRKMRARKNHTPVLMLTALDSVDERVSGLKLGADDYLPKPFDFDELIARIKALVRRNRDFAGADHGNRLTMGEVSMDTQSLLVTAAGKPVELTAKERDILILFMRNAGRVLTRERILNAAWSSQEDPLTNVVDVYVGRLRKKLGATGDLIQTVRGLGYRFGE